MSDTKPFHIGDVLSITTGCLLSPRHMEGVYDILHWMTGESIYTHQIPRCIREAAPVLLAMHPQLGDIGEIEVAPDTFDAFLAVQVTRFGETLPVPKMTEDQHERIEPISELAEKIHPSRIVIISPE